LSKIADEVEQGLSHGLFLRLRNDAAAAAETIDIKGLIGRSCLAGGEQPAGDGFSAG
jgi:hypothetical protein